MAHSIIHVPPARDGADHVDLPAIEPKPVAEELAVAILVWIFRIRGISPRDGCAEGHEAQVEVFCARREGCCGAQLRMFYIVMAKGSGVSGGSGRE